MSGPNMDPDLRVGLAEIKGDVKLILAGQDRTNRDVSDIKRTIESHHGRITTLESDKHKALGAAGALKWIYGGLGFVASSVAAIIARHFGV